VKRRLREAKAGEIRAVARDFFRLERLNLAMVSPLNTTNRLASTSPRLPAVEISARVRRNDNRGANCSF
jgi:hypothetical protein